MEVARGERALVRPVEYFHGVARASHEEEVPSGDIEHRREVRLVARPFEQGRGALRIGDRFLGARRERYSSREPLDHAVPRERDRLDALVTVRTGRLDRLLEDRCRLPDVPQLEVKLRELGQELPRRPPSGA